MTVTLYTESMAHGVKTRTKGKTKNIISFRKNRGNVSNQSGNYPGDAYTMTSCVSFSVGQVIKYGENFYKVTRSLSSLAYVYQYQLEVQN